MRIIQDRALNEQIRRHYRTRAINAFKWLKLNTRSIYDLYPLKRQFEVKIIRSLHDLGAIDVIFELDSSKALKVGLGNFSNLSYLRQVSDEQIQVFVTQLLKHYYNGGCSDEDS